MHLRLFLIDSALSQYLTSPHLASPYPTSTGGRMEGYLPAMLPLLIGILNREGTPRTLLENTGILCCFDLIGYHSLFPIDKASCSWIL